MNGGHGTRDIEGKAARVAASEWSRGDGGDIDGKTERSKCPGGHESMRAKRKFQLRSGEQNN